MFDLLREVAARLDGLTAFPDVPTLDARLLAPLRDVSGHAFEHVLELQQPTPKRRDSKKQPPKGVASLYDLRITDARRIPTRERSWHDVMNAIVFAAFPSTKTALHARQAGELSRHFATNGKLPNARSRLQDVLALFDEGGVVLFGDGASVARAHPALLEGGEVLGAMVKERRLRAVVFGHAILEHAILGAPLPRAAPVLVEDDDAFGPEVRGRLDRALTSHVAALSGEPGPPALDLSLLFERTKATR